MIAVESGPDTGADTATEGVSELPSRPYRKERRHVAFATGGTGEHVVKSQGRGC